MCNSDYAEDLFLGRSIACADDRIKFTYSCKRCNYVKANMCERYLTTRHKNIAGPSATGGIYLVCSNLVIN